MSDSVSIDRKKYDDLRRKFCKARKLLREFCDLIVELGNAAIDEEVTGNRKEYKKVEMSLVECGDRVQDQLWRWEKKQ